jgi:dihydroorotase
MALPVVIETLVKPGLMAWSDVARVFSSAPATIGSLAGYDAPLTIGSQAHLTLVDPSVMSLGPRGSLSSNNPYPENALPGRVMFTFHHGVATVAGGELVDAHLVSLEGRR